MSIKILLAFLYLDDGYLPLADMETGSYLPGPGVVRFSCMVISSGSLGLSVNGVDFSADGN